MASFCSGSVDSDVIPLSTVQEGVEGFRIAIVPTQREGVEVQGDWNNMGQRQTDSGSIRFTNVWVAAEEILAPHPGGEVFRTFRSCLTQITVANIYLGVVQGAFEAARSYTRSQTRAWPGSKVESATEDPYILQHYGEMAIALNAATQLLKLGANPNLATRGSGITPLHAAAEKGHAALVSALIDAGANPRAKNAEGKSPGQLAHNSLVKMQLPLHSK